MMNEHTDAGAPPALATRERETLPVALMSWKSVRKGALLGFASVRIGRALIVHDCPVLASASGMHRQGPEHRSVGVYNTRSIRTGL